MSIKRQAATLSMRHILCPAEVPRGITHNDASWCDVPRDHSAGADQRAGANGHSREDDGASAQRCPTTNARLGKCHRTRTTAWKWIVSEGYIRPDEDIILNPETIPELHAGLDRDSVADLDIALDQGLRTKVAIGADGRPRQNDDELPDARSRADCALRDVSQSVYERGLSDGH